MGEYNSTPNKTKETSDFETPHVFSIKFSYFNFFSLRSQLV